jgi:hypothetical protein
MKFFLSQLMVHLMVMVGFAAPIKIQEMMSYMPGYWHGSLFWGTTKRKELFREHFHVICTGFMNTENLSYADYESPEFDNYF